MGLPYYENREDSLGKFKVFEVVEGISINPNGDGEKLRTSSAGDLQFPGSTSGAVTVKAQSAAGTWTMQLPTSTGSNGQVLQTNGSGVTSWVDQSGGGGGGAAPSFSRPFLMMGG